MVGNEAGTFGALLRRYRQAAGLSQAALAARAGLSAVAISALERATRRAPDLGTLERLAGALALAAEQRTALHAAARAGGAPVGTPAGAAAPPGGTRPTGTVTFLFTDIEGSTALWERHPALMQVAFARQEALVRGAILAHGGYPYKQIGDAFQAAFQVAPQALAAALAAQRALAAADWGELGALRVRMALHSGQTEERPDDYVGPLLNRVARLLAAGHGGQVLLSAATVDLLREGLGEGLELRDLGAQRLRDLARAEPVYQLLAPDLPQDFPPLRTLDAPTHNLPAPASALVGREEAVGEVQALLAGARLVTLVGSGGVGKTRLALAAAAGLVERYAAGVWLVELAGVAEPELVAGTVAQVLGVREEAGRALTATLSAYLQQKRLLLLLDNCEHLVAACADLAAGLLRACPQLCILATSREGLEVAGERRWRVPSLPTPDLAHLPPPARLAESAAVALFVARARERRADFALTDQNARAVAQVCARLDGIPLAIELAAARVGVLPVEGIAARLDDRLRLLTGGGRDVLPRQRTLRAALDWSYDLLGAQEQVVLDRLAAFAGGCALPAVEAVCAGEGVEDWELLDLLGPLVNKSLVQAEERGDGEVRYWLLETVRQYGQERLAASGEAAGVRDRHLRWCLALAEEAAAHLQGAEQAQWLDRLETEHDNLRAAMGWCVQGGAAAAGLNLAVALLLFWELRGHLSEGRRWLAAALAAAGAAAVPSVRAAALKGAGALAWKQGDHGAATALLTESLALYRGLDDAQGIADTLHNLAIVAAQQSHYAQAAAWYEEGLALYRGLGQPQEVARLLMSMGNVAALQGQHERARGLYEEALALFRSIGNRRLIAVLLYNLGWLSYLQAEAEAATALLHESLALSRELGDKRAQAAALWLLGTVAQQQGERGQAGALLEESIALARELGDRQRLADGLTSLGQLAVEEGAQGRAHAHLAESLRLHHEIGDQRSVAAALEEMAHLAEVRGEGISAGRLWGAAAAVRAAIGAPLSPTEREAQERAVAATSAAVGEAAFAAAWADGEALSLEQAIAEALAAEPGVRCA